MTKELNENNHLNLKISHYESLSMRYSEFQSSVKIEYLNRKKKERFFICLLKVRIRIKIVYW